MTTEGKRDQKTRPPRRRSIDRELAMALVIPIDECLSDSPTFRRLLSQSEGNLEDLEARLDKTLKLSNGVGECGRAYVTQQTQFLASLWELSSYFGLEQGGGSAGSALAHINRMIQVMRLPATGEFRACSAPVVRDVMERSSPPTPIRLTYRLIHFICSLSVTMHSDRGSTVVGVLSSIGVSSNFLSLG